MLRRPECDHKHTPPPLPPRDLTRFPGEQDDEGQESLADARSPGRGGPWGNRLPAGNLKPAYPPPGPAPELVAEVPCPASWVRSSSSKACAPPSARPARRAGRRPAVLAGRGLSSPGPVRRLRGRHREAIPAARGGLPPRLTHPLVAVLTLQRADGDRQVRTATPPAGGGPTSPARGWAPDERMRIMDACHWHRPARLPTATHTRHNGVRR
jgi:hypothetical protein